MVIDYQFDNNIKNIVETYSVGDARKVNKLVGSWSSNTRTLGTNGAVNILLKIFLFRIQRRKLYKAKTRLDG